MHRSRLRNWAAGAATIGLVGLTSACGGSSEAADPGSDEIASLVDDTELTVTDGSDGGDAAADVDIDEAALEFSECLRNEGLDVPDLGVDADGNINMRDAFAEAGPGQDGFGEAMEVCGEILEGVAFGGGAGGARDDSAIADSFLELTECIRAEGFEDIPDLTFQAPGGRPGADGEAPAAGADGDATPEPGQGRGQGDFGDRTSQIATQLDLDPDDPEVIAALDECMPILDSALGGFGGAGGAATEEG